MDELYDLDADPYEETNIIDQSRRARHLTQMQSELRRLLAATEVPVTSRRPARPRTQ